MIIQRGPASLHFAPDGRLAELRTQARPQVSYLSGITLSTCRLAAQEGRWTPTEANVDPDEVESSYSYGDLRAVVRSSFQGGWWLRISIRNTGTGECRLPILIGGIGKVGKFPSKGDGNPVSP